MSDGKRKTDQRALEAYLENRDAYEEGLAPDVKRLVDSLQQWPHEARLQPRAGFTNELVEQLKDKRSGARGPWTVWPVLSRVLAGAAAVAALLLFAFFVTGLFRQPVLSPPVDQAETPLPQVKLVGIEGLFAGVEFRLDAPLGDEAQQLPLYMIEAAPLPETPDAVREMALNLGLENPRVYEAYGQVEGWMVEDEAGRRLTIDRNHVRFPIVYHAPVSSGSETRALSFEDASAVALRFLEQAQLLPEEYQVREQLPEGDDGLARVEIVPTLEGHPVHYVSSEVAIDGTGMVVEARVQPLLFAATDETITIQPALSAFQQILESRVTIDARRYSQLVGLKETYFPTFTQSEQGSQVTLVGYITTLRPVGDNTESEATELELSQFPENADAYQLSGPRATELENEFFAEVSGTLVEQLPGGRWRIAVSEWTSLSSDVESAIQCKDGILRREEGGVEFLTNEGESFVLAYPPDALMEVPAYACASFADGTPRQPIWWLTIISPAPIQMRSLNAVAEAKELEPGLEESGAIPETLVVDWATSGYIYTPHRREQLPGQLLTPAWLFYAQSPDGTLKLVLRVPAEAEE